MKKRIVLLDNSLPNLSPELRVAQAHGAELIVLEGPPESDAIAALNGADVILSQGAHYPVSSAMISAMNEGGHILKYGAGYDKVDLVAAATRNVTVTNLPDGTTTEVAEHAAALMLSLLRRLVSYSDTMKSGQWNPTLDAALIRPFNEVTIGFIGYGRIGQMTHQKLRSLGFKFAAYDPYQNSSSVPEDLKLTDLKSLAQEAQVLSLHLASSSETIGIVDMELLEILGPEGYIVNVSRGALVNEADLIEALTNGTIAGAALDAFAVEPLPLDSPLRTCPNLQISPHSAFYSTASNPRVQRLLSEELDRVLSGQPVRCLVR